MVFLETGLNRDGVLGTGPPGVPAHPVTFSFHNCSWFCEVAGFQGCCRAGEKGVQLRQSLQNQLCLQRFRCCFPQHILCGLLWDLSYFPEFGAIVTSASLLLQRDLYSTIWEIYVCCFILFLPCFSFRCKGMPYVHGFSSHYCLSFVTRGGAFLSGLPSPK